MTVSVIPFESLAALPVPAHDDQSNFIAPSSGIAYHLVTLGCPKNVVDSDGFETLMRRAGHVPADRPSAADLLVVNTCGFIDAAKEESIGAVLELASAKRPGQQLIVAGCLTQLYGDELGREIPEIDHIFGVDRWAEVAALAGPAPRAPYDIPETQPPQPGRVSAYLKISDGCDRPCTFCIIPTIKGRLTSAPAEVLLDQGRRLVAEGARELVLVAQDSTAYGEDAGRRDALADLLHTLAEAVPDTWLRLMYAYPGRVTPRLIRAMAEIPSVVPYLDMPLQHGSVSVLRRMKRPSNLAMVRRTIDGLREAMPEVALRTSLIVGFPGETEEEFAELLAFVEAMQFDHLGVFTYSPQERTPAATMPGHVPERVKKARRNRVMALQQEIALRRGKRLVGRDVDVLVERAGPNTATGRSYRDAPEVDGTVHLAPAALPGTIVRARITRAEPYDLYGTAAS